MGISDWRLRHFGDCAVLVRDTVAPSNINDSPYIGLEHIGEGSLSLLGIGSSQDVTSTKSKFKSGDILFGKLRPYFRKVVRAQFEGVCSTDIWVVRPRSGIDPGFLFYWMASTEFVDASMRGSEGTKMPRAKWDFVAQIKKPVPPLPEQRAIAAVLGALDDKIELNRRMNGTLEAMARALFKSWFVDFDPVRAKMAGQETGLPEEIAALFPEEMEDGRPLGWGEGALSDFATLNPENWSKNTRPAIIDYLDLSNAKWGRIEKVISYPLENAPSRAQRVLRPGDTIVGTVRPGNGSYALITESGLTGSTGFAVLRPQEKGLSEFVYLAATNPENIERLSHLADGGAYPAVRPEVVLATTTTRPSVDLIALFHKIVGPLLSKIAENDTESSTLATMRDALLPKLMSGEVRVPLAEQEAADAL